MNRSNRGDTNPSANTELIQTYRALRAFSGTTYVKQTISELRTDGQTYRLQFYYANYAYFGPCTLTVAFGGAQLFTKNLPQVPTTGSINPYSLVTVNAINPVARVQSLEFDVTCKTNAQNFVLIDDVALGTPSGC